MKIPSNHILASSSYEVANICAPLFARYYLSFFAWGRFFDDGTCYLLSNNYCVYKFLFEKKYKIVSPIPETILAKKFYYFLRESGAYKPALYDLRQFFGISNVIDLIERYDGYFDMICYASDLKKHDAVNFYLNNIDVLEKFNASFQENASDLIHISEKNKIILPPSMRPTFGGIQSKELPQKNYVPTIVLSKQQTECLCWLVKGMTIKQIAKVMHLSHRTIEFYIENIKIKLHCSTRYELIEKALRMTVIRNKILGKEGP